MDFFNFNRLNSLEAIVLELKKAKTSDPANYLALLEQKDHEYKAELKNFLKKVKNHVDEQRYTLNSSSGDLNEDVGKRLRSFEKV